MRSLLVVVLFSAAGVAGAHPLGPEQSLFEQLAHQMLGGHHLPLMLLVAAVVVFAARGALRRRQ